MREGLGQQFRSLQGLQDRELKLEDLDPLVDGMIHQRIHKEVLWNHRLWMEALWMLGSSGGLRRKEGLPQCWLALWQTGLMWVLIEGAEVVV